MHRVEIVAGTNTVDMETIDVTLIYRTAYENYNKIQSYIVAIKI